MAVNLEQLRAYPKKEEEVLPTLNDEQIATQLRAKIQLVKDDIELPRRYHRPWQRQRYDLLHIIGGKPHTKVTNTEEHHVGTAEPVQLQRVALEVMTEYGMDSGIYARTQGPVQVGEGNVTTREIHDFPSQTIPGLVFERWLDTNAAGDPLSLSWNVRDQAPSFKFSVR